MSVAIHPGNTESSEGIYFMFAFDPSTICQSYGAGRTAYIKALRFLHCQFSPLMAAVAMDSIQLPGECMFFNFLPSQQKVKRKITSAISVPRAKPQLNGLRISRGRQAVRY